ncbi:hypothetical protein B0H15DRAFT_462579 [Mycena belliarum]|uniref:F-box domain-containing protein n=1 Tax=Mycena belliarum TaxID=1033014 RepID=A0AAD6UJ55_9AGAR|nr:hypothetical protein B0H15DRAFT_462579 [Mycena belliae]
MSLLELPRELILLILDHIPEKDLTTLYQVNSLTKHLALVALLVRYGISPPQLQSQELSNISSRALPVLSVCFPDVLQTIRTLELHFDPRDVDHLDALAHLAERFPIIPRVTIAFCEPPSRIQILSQLWIHLSTALVALLGDTLRPVVLIRFAEIIAVRPRPPKLLKRALRTSDAAPIADRAKLIKKIQYSIATLCTHRPFTGIDVRSFTQPDAMLGSLIVLNPSAIFHLTIGGRVISPREWECVMAGLHLPFLRTLIISVPLESRPLSAFLELHDHIEHLEYTADRGKPHTDVLLPFSASVLPALTQLTASARILAHVLQDPVAFPILRSVCIASKAEDPEDFQAALRAIAQRPSVTTLMIQINSSSLPWKTPGAGVEDTLAYVQELHIVRWTTSAESAAFPAWLAKFPALADLTIAGNGPLLSDGLLDRINTTCPHVLVKQERRFQ